MQEEDPIVMYLAVRTSLRMSPGKLSVQVGHAVQILCLRYPESTGTRREDFLKWLAADYPKVALRATDAEFDSLKDVYLDSVTVVDNGRTELPPGSETVIGFWPMRKSARVKTLKRLRLLEAKDLGLGPLDLGDLASPSK